MKDNPKIKICIFGASGFVGRALTERLSKRENIEIKAIIHSPGNSWSLLRLGIPLYQADQMNSKLLDEVLSDCTHVVNLALGEFENMVACLNNLISSCLKNKITRLVHISSVTVYGEFPKKNSEYESGSIQSKKYSYGWYKEKQDNLIYKANKEGLSSVVLCPPHITGAYARLFHQVIDGIKNGTFALVDDGIYPCNIVDVNNLCQAIELSLFISDSDGKRIFITNGDNFKWKDLAMLASNLAGVKFEDIPRISSSEALKLTETISLMRFLKLTIKSNDIKTLANKTFFKQNKLIYLGITKIYKIFGLNKTIEKLSLNSSDNKDLNPNLNLLSPWLCKQQLRGVRHRIDKACDVLNYSPTVDSIQSFMIFEDYYKALYGYESDYWELSKLLS